MTVPKDLTAASDRELVKLALEYDQRAYNELVERYMVPVYLRISRIVKNPDRAGDLTQDTLGKLVLQLATYDRKREFGPWLLGIAGNTAHQYLERQRFDSANSPFCDTPGAVDRAGIGLPSPLDEPTPPPEATKATKAAKAKLRAALRRLTPDQRRCIKLWYGNGRSHKEIAKQLHMPVGTVKSHLSRAKKRLAAIPGLLPDAEPDAAS